MPVFMTDRYFQESFCSYIFLTGSNQERSNGVGMLTGIVVELHSCVRVTQQTYGREWVNLDGYSIPSLKIVATLKFQQVHVWHCRVSTVASMFPRSWKTTILSKLIKYKRRTTMTPRLRRACEHGTTQTKVRKDGTKAANMYLRLSGNRALHILLRKVKNKNTFIYVYRLTARSSPQAYSYRVLICQHRSAAKYEQNDFDMLVRNKFYVELNACSVSVCIS